MLLCFDSEIDPCGIIQVGYINGKELTLACSKEHTTLEYNCDDHRNLSSKANEKAVSASISNMALKGYTFLSAMLID